MTRTVVRRTLVAVLLATVFASPGRAEILVSLALVIDRSGSLSPEDLGRVRELADSVFASLPTGSETAVFVFDDQSRLLCPLTSNPDAVRKALGQVKTTGRFTALHDALYDASRYLRDAGHGRRAILLVTDGKDENSALILEDGLRVAQETSIPVFAVGVGHVEERILRRIAKLTSGQYLPIREARGAPLAALLLESGPAPVSAAAAASPAAPEAPRPAKAGPAPSPAARPATGLSPRVLAAGLLVTAAAAVIAVLGLRRRSRARCPRCGGELPSALSPCATCREASVPVRDAADALSETVVARMNLTEEYLEKTVALRERPVLVVTRGTATGEVVSLSLAATTSIGRAKANDIVLEDLSVSSQHCRVRPEEGRFVLHDLKSTNGTFVNERRVTRHPLAEGDVVKVGETTLQFRMERRPD
jgi:hypothetical protein